MRNIKITIWMLALVLAALYISPSQAETETAVFDDGETHDINYVIFDDPPDDHTAAVEVRDSNSTGQFTTVNLLNGGRIDNLISLFAYDNSRVNVSGGGIEGFLGALDNSRVTCSDGYIGRGLITCNNSRVNVSGGIIGGHLWTYDNSRVTISGGEIDGLWICNNSRVTITGGEIRGFSTSRSHSAPCFFGKKGRPICDLSIIRGESASCFPGKKIGPIRHSWAHPSPQVTISGGSIRYRIEVGRGYSEESVVKFIGSDFAVDGNAVGYGRIDTGGQESINGILTGILASGDSLDVEFYIYDDSSIILAPEAELAVDIMPGSCPNPFNIKSRGILSVAILGTEYLNVMDINPDSVRLEGVKPIHSRYKDTATPVADGNECDCTKAGPDGYPDLVLKFRTQDIVDELINTYTSEELFKGAILPLTLTAELFDGTVINGIDCVVLVGNVGKHL